MKPNALLPKDRVLRALQAARAVLGASYHHPHCLKLSRPNVRCTCGLDHAREQFNVATNELALTG